MTVLCCGASFAFAGSGSAAEHIEKAEVAFEELASETGYQWTVTVNAIKAAKEALEAGNEDEALAQAKRAMDLVEATRVQAELESENWKMRVPK
jgi:hypothetical protein